MNKASCELPTDEFRVITWCQKSIKNRRNQAIA